MTRCGRAVCLDILNEYYYYYYMLISTGTLKTVFRPTHYVCEFLYRISVFLHELMIRMLCKARHCSLPRSFANILSMLMQLLHFEVWLK